MQDNSSLCLSLSLYNKHSPHWFTHSFHSSHVDSAASWGLRQTTLAPGAGLDTAPAEVQLRTQTKLARWGQRLDWTSIGMVQIWTVALILGLMKASLDFFHGGMEAQGNSFDFASDATNKPYHQILFSLVGLLECFPVTPQEPHFHQQHQESLVYGPERCDPIPGVLEGVFSSLY